jgi:hypothetical protein
MADDFPGNAAAEIANSGSGASMLERCLRSGGGEEEEWAPRHDIRAIHGSATGLTVTCSSVIAPIHWLVLREEETGTVDFSNAWRRRLPIRLSA